MTPPDPLSPPEPLCSDRVEDDVLVTESSDASDDHRLWTSDAVAGPMPLIDRGPERPTPRTTDAWGG